MEQRTEEEVGAARSSRRGGDRSILLRKAMDLAFFLLSSVLCLPWTEKVWKMSKNVDETVQGAGPFK